MVECRFTTTETVDLLGMGAQDGHLDFHTAPKLVICMKKIISIYTLIFQDVRRGFQELGGKEGSWRAGQTCGCVLAVNVKHYHIPPLTYTHKVQLYGQLKIETRSKKKKKS